MQLDVSNTPIACEEVGKDRINYEKHEGKKIISQLNEIRNKFPAVPEMNFQKKM